MEHVLFFFVFVAALLLLMTTGTPVAVALGLIGVLGTLYVATPAQLVRLAQIAFTRSSDFVFIVIPLFILMGDLLAAGKIGDDLFSAAQKWLNWLPGSLAVSTIFACAGFGAVCGSSPVTAATIGSVAVPQMWSKGYDRRLALGATASGGTLGIMIPPSVAFILYGIITETSVGQLFIAGIIPGIVLAVMLSLTVVLMVRRRPEMAPATPGVTWSERWQALGKVWPTAILSVVVLGSIYTGVATPTEAAAVGAGGAIVLGLLQRRLTWAGFSRSILGCVKTTSMLMLLLVSGLFASFALTRLGVPQGFATFLTSLPVSPWVIIVLINVLLGIFGMLLDPLSILVITLPIFFPAVVKLGYDPIWFGVIMTLNTEIAAITPPVGFNLFILKAVIPGAEMLEVIRGSLIFIIPLAAGIALLMLVPDLALVLPRLMR
jgi:C4-dicarboxylate transporter, DctM subunit